MKKFLSGSIAGKSGEYKIHSGSYVVYQDEKSGSFTIDIGTLTGIGVTFLQAVQDLTDQIKEEEWYEDGENAKQRIKWAIAIRMEGP